MVVRPLFSPTAPAQRCLFVVAPTSGYVAILRVLEKPFGRLHLLMPNECTLIQISAERHRRRCVGVIPRNFSIFRGNVIKSWLFRGVVRVLFTTAVFYDCGRNARIVNYPRTRQIRALFRHMRLGKSSDAGT